MGIKINPRHVEEIMKLQHLKSSLRQRIIKGDVGLMPHLDDCLGVIPNECSKVLVQLSNNAVTENIEEAIAFCEERLVELGISKEDAKKEIIIHAATAKKLQGEWLEKRKRLYGSIEVPRSQRAAR